MGLKILSVSDKVSAELLEVGEEPRACRSIDLILSCGDLPPEFLSSLRHRFDAPLMYVQGNHDLRYGNAPPVGCTCIDRRIVTFDNRKIIGFSGSRWYNGGGNQYTEKQMQSFIGRMRFSLWRGKPDIVVTHAPPRHIHDAEDPCHKGFKCFAGFIDKYKPAYFIHGHIHKLFSDDGQRITRVNTTQVVNSYGYYIFEI